MFDNLEDIKRYQIDLHIQKQRFGNKVLAVIDLPFFRGSKYCHEPNSRNESLTDLAGWTYEASGGFDDDSINAENKLAEFAAAHEDFLFAMEDTVYDCLVELDKRAGFWLDSDNKEEILDMFIDFIPDEIYGTWNF